MLVPRRPGARDRSKSLFTQSGAYVDRPFQLANHNRTRCSCCSAHRGSRVQHAESNSLAGSIWPRNGRETVLVRTG